MSASGINCKKQKHVLDSENLSSAVAAWDDAVSCVFSPARGADFPPPFASINYDADVAYEADSETKTSNTFFLPPNWSGQNVTYEDDECDGSADTRERGHDDNLEGLDGFDITVDNRSHSEPALEELTDSGVVPAELTSANFDHAVSITLLTDDSHISPSSPGFDAVTQDQLMYNGQSVYFQSDTTYIRIHQFLRGFNAPLGAFDGLLSLLKEEAIKNSFDPKAHHPSRSKLLKKLGTNSDPSLAPQTHYIELENSNSRDENPHRAGKDIAEVHCFNAEAVIKHLLMDNNLCGKQSNLALDLNRPFDCPSACQPLGEVTTGSWYQQAWSDMIKDAMVVDGVPVCENGFPLFMVPLIIYLDKTGTSVMQRHGVEPVMVTLAFLTQKARNKTDESWRPLGYMPDFDLKSRAEKKRERSTLLGKGCSCRNYHLCLEAVLQSLIDFQQNKTATMIVKLGKHLKKVTIRCPVAFIIGDTKSQDMLCCRVAHYSQPRTCYACYTPFLKLSCFNHVCKFVTQKEQFTLLKDCMLPGKELDPNLMAKLKATSTIRCFSKGMFSLDYGGTVQGQFAACTLDLMHAFESGVCRDVCKAFVDPIPDRYKEQLDKFVDNIFARQRCTGRNKCLRTNFSKGITNATLLTSNEWAGLLLMYLIVAQTYQGSSILDSGRYDEDDTAAKKTAFKRQRKRKVKDLRTGGLFKRKKSLDSNDQDLDDKERESLLKSDGEENEDAPYDGPQCNSSDFIQLAEQLLAFHAYYSQKKEFWKQGDQNGERTLHRAMAVMLEQLTGTLCREGNGWNTAKVHSTFRHVAKLISLYGRPTNCDAEVGERGLKGWAKRPAKVTNKGSAADFLRQVALRYYESNLFTSGAQAREWRNSVTDRKVQEEEEDANLSVEAVGMRGKCKYLVTYDRSCNSYEDVTCSVVTSQWCGSWNHKGVVELPSSVKDAIANIYFPDEEEDEEDDSCFKECRDDTAMSAMKVQGFTEYVGHKGVVFRAHPNFGNKGLWNDWSIIKCPNNGVDLSRNPFPDDRTVPKKKPLDGEGPPIKKEEEYHRRTKSRNRIEKPISWCEQHHGPQYVPAKIIVLYKDPVTGINMALVHACRPWMQKNYDRTSAITESWHLQYVRDEHLFKNKSPMRPFYNEVEASSLTENVFVVEETPGIHECLPDKVYTGHVIYITDRKEIWPRVFL